MKTYSVLRRIMTVPIIALAGIVIVTTCVSSILDQSTKATVVSVGDVQEIGSNTNMTTREDLNPLLGRIFLNGTDSLTSFTPINDTFTKVSYSGNRTIIPINAITAIGINATDTGDLSINLQPNGITIVKGHSILTTKAEFNSVSKQENATVTLVDLNGVRSDDPKSSTGVAFFKTNSTGHLAFLDDMIAIYQVKASPEGTDIRMWEWKGADIQFG